ncbi:MAG: diaminopimelate epimerase [Bacteroidota bacterium]
MEHTFYKYHGAGNDFILIDNRGSGFPADNISYIEWLCDRRFGIGADGLMLLQEYPGFDFEMRYFNSDGREASMCGNGGRCIAAFASRLGIIGSQARFLAVDGPHEAILEPDGDVNLKMSDVSGVDVSGHEYYLDTGSPHFVRFLDSLEGLDVYQEGKAVRYSDRFREKGTNVNFVQQEGMKLTVYTYERGVEAETLACGTGITASALSAALRSGVSEGNYEVKAKGGNLSVSFEKSGAGFTNVWLKGPATFVFRGTIEGPSA